MCQLTLIDLGNKMHNRIAAVVFMRENSRVSNKDGCGLYNPSAGVLRTEKPASTLANLGGKLKISNMDSDAIMCHVRNATTWMDKKLLTSEHNHPFPSEHFVFEHNGSLKFKEDAKEAEYKDKELIDSEVFLAELEKHYTGDVIKDLTATMDLFRGKFAFILYHRPEKKYYVVRGKTAILHISEIEVDYGGDKKVTGVIINTELDSINYGLLSVSNILALLGVEMKFTDPKQLETETIYRLDDHILVKVGELKETPKEVVSYNTGFTKGANPNGNLPAIAATAGANQVTTSRWLSGFLVRNEMNITELDWTAEVLFDKGMLDFIPDDFHKLIKLLTELERRNNAKYKRLWRTMRNYNSVNFLYKRYPGLEFPYFLTDMKEFKGIYHKESERLAPRGVKFENEDGN